MKKFKDLIDNVKKSKANKNTQEVLRVKNISNSNSLNSIVSQIEKLNFKQIKNNLNDFVDIDQFMIHPSYSFRDLYINENKIFISFVEQIRDNCWNTSVVQGKIDYEIIKFQKLFSSKDCINHEGTPASGGRIVNYDNNNILLTVGEFHSSFLSQDKESINGKIIKINKDSSEYKIIFYF